MYPKTLRILLALLLWCLGFPLQAQPPVSLPNWSELVMEVSPALVVKIQVDSSSGGKAIPHLLEYPDALWPDPAETLYHLTVETRLKWFLSSKSWLGELWFKPDLTALQRTRLKSGKTRNFKIYRYAKGRVYRVRHQPKGEEISSDPLIWPIENKRVYEFPPQISKRCSRITDPYALLLLLSQGGFDKERKLCIFNKKTVYEVTLRREGKQQINVDYLFRDKPVQTTVMAEKIAILPNPMQRDFRDSIEPFELLGMEGNIIALVDPENHLPLLFEGKVPGFGQAKLSLTQVRPRAQPPQN